MHYSICVCGGGKKVVSAFVATKDAMDDVALTTNNLILEAIKIGWIPDKLTKSWEQWLLWTTTLNHAHSYLQKNVIKIINDKQTQKSSPCVRPQTYNDINFREAKPLSQTNQVSRMMNKEVIQMTLNITKSSNWHAGT